MLTPLRRNLRHWMRASGARRWASGFQQQAAASLLQEMASQKETKILTEYDALKVVGAFGIGTLEHYVHKIGDPIEGLPSQVPAVSAVKGILRYKDGTLVTHKTEYKAIELAVPRERAQEIVNTFVQRFENTELHLEGLMFREWLEYEPNLGNEILLSAYQDHVFGPCVVVTFGGVLVNAYKDKLNIRPVVIPALYGVDSFLPQLKASTLVKFLTGQLRGTKKLCDWEQLEQATRSIAEGIAHFSSYNTEAEFVIDEIEVNPAAVRDGQIVALDSVVKVSPYTPHLQSSKPIQKLQIMLQPRSMGLIGVSEKVKNKTWAEEAAGAAFKWIAKTPVADFGLKYITKFSVFRETKPTQVKQETPKNPPTGLKKRAVDFLKNAIVPQNFNPCNSILAQAANTGLALYPIHQKASVIQDVPCVKSLDEMKAKNGGKPVDVLVVAIPAKDAVKTLKECFLHHYCESVQLFSAGFAETEAGRHLQQELLQSLVTVDPVERPLINGPNTVGNWVSGPHAFNTIFADDPRALMKTKRGSQRVKPVAALICQSGGFAVARLSGFSSIVHTSLCVTVGNQMDVTACDVLENLLHNGPPKGTPEPVVVGIYMEGLAFAGDGLRLMKLVSQARRKGITVVLYKAGRTPAGQKAVASHTASMATDYETFIFMLKHAGVVIADSLDDFHTLVSTAALLGPSLKHLIITEEKPETVGICGVTNSGYLKCAMADALPPHLPGMVSQLVPAFYEPETRQAIEEIFAEHRLTDVVDIGDFLDLTPAIHVKGWYAILRYLIKDPNPVAYIFAPVITPKMVPNPDVFYYVFEMIQAQQPTKKFIVCMESGSRYAPLRQKLWASGIPCFECADAAMEVVGKLLQAWLRPF